MSRSWLSVSILACTLAVVVSCGKHSSTPSSPTATSPDETGAAADGSVLKATAPAPQAPINGEKPTDPTIVLRAGNATTKFVTGVPLTYRFEIYNAAGQRVYQSPAVPQGSNGVTSHEVISGDLVEDQTYQWQVRAEYLGLAGPWSSRASFVAPNASGYIRGSEVYDPLTNGRTVGDMSGAVTLIPGLGAKLESQDARIKYALSTLQGGEFSILCTNLLENTKGGKTKLFSMAEGDADITENRRRFTIEKRGDPPGVIAWRVITSSDQIDTIGSERVHFPFKPEQTYFWKATWGNGNFNLLIKEGGVNGATIYDWGKPYSGVYDPNPHYAWIGAPISPRSGIDSGSVDRVIIRQVWISNRPRPAFANK
jgi:hypothetical protein